MLVVESMDADTFSRRVATVGLEAARYMDLFEGGGDFTEHNLRLTTFWGLAALDQQYQMYLSGSVPTRMRIQLLHTEAEEGVLLSMPYLISNLVDVMVDGARVVVRSPRVPCVAASCSLKRDSNRS